MPMKRARNQARRAGPKFSYRPPDIVSVSYQSAMLRTVADAERVAVHKFSAPDIPSEVLEAIRSERGEALGGAHGDPSWGEPIQFDRVVIEQPQRTTDIRVYNRAIQLFMKDSEMIRRIHRFAKQCARHSKGQANYRVNLTVRPFTALAADASTVAVRPAGY